MLAREYYMVINTNNFWYVNNVGEHKKLGAKSKMPNINLKAKSFKHGQVPSTAPDAEKTDLLAAYWWVDKGLHKNYPGLETFCVWWQLHRCAHMEKLPKPNP